MRTKTMLTGVTGVVIGLLLAAAGIVVAGSSLNPPSVPTDGASQMYTLQQIYDRLATGAAGTKMTAFTEPSSGPTPGTMPTLDEVMAKAPAVDATNGATTAQVLSGKTFWGLTAGAWGLQSGTAAAGSNVSGTDGSKTFNIPDGFYSGKTATANDANLVAGNIKQGVSIFGVAGTYAGSAGANAAVPKTGQTTSYGTRDDGALQKGVTWPNPRFTDNSNGTVTDNLTGLIWLKNANCYGTRNWANALSDANALANGTCGLSDGSTAGQWRLPNVREMQSLVHHGFTSPAVPNTAGTGKWATGNPFTGVQSNYYWTSTTYAGLTSSAWIVYLLYGAEDTFPKSNTFYVWPVRGGQ